ncbi:hypothetical protein C1S80_19260 [Mycolicibacterium aubagnense]|nr:hypothetical protein C1S80_19260 [Mycolicibacterium aubagnense]
MQGPSATVIDAISNFEIAIGQRGQRNRAQRGCQQGCAGLGIVVVGEFIGTHPQQQCPAVGHSDLLVQRIARILVFERPFHDECLDHRRIHHAVQRLHRDRGVTQVRLRCLYQVRVGCPILVTVRPGGSVR